jgi:hypothetical protein
MMAIGNPNILLQDRWNIIASEIIIKDMETIMLDLICIHIKAAIKETTTEMAGRFVEIRNRSKGTQDKFAMSEISGIEIVNIIKRELDIKAIVMEVNIESKTNLKEI